MTSWADGQAADRLRAQLVQRGLADDGVLLRGPLTWTHPTAGRTTARVEIELDERYPFAPPQVRVLDPGCPLNVTFHIERAPDPGTLGNLCLWDSDWPVDQAPWLDAGPLLQRIAGWLERTAAGWPGDDVCDLERYLEQNREFMVLYDADALAQVTAAAVRFERRRTPPTVFVTSAVRPVRDPRRGKARNRKNRLLAWVDDLGEVAQPVSDWATLEPMLADRAAKVGGYIESGGISLLLLRYQRGGKGSVLAVEATYSVNGIELTACESADTSSATRQMRAGRLAPELARVSIAVVGCGAVGSFAADMLFRSGFRNITLLDQERLRPGNVVRHLAGNRHVGQWKVDAVRDCLADVEDDVAAVTPRPESLRTVMGAVDLVEDHRVVLDATGDGVASSLLAAAASSIVGTGDGHAVVSVCVQREGDIVRVDRLPPRGADTYLPPLAAIDDSDHPRERGCGSPVSRTPPGAVVAAAELACRVVIDEAAGHRKLPASMADVRREQSEPPYDRVGLVSSQASPQRLTA